VPRLAVSAIVLCLLLYAGALVGALLPAAPAALPEDEREPERLAA
jgi:hypothetical protein